MISTRIKKELSDFKTDPIEEVKLEVSEEKIDYWIANLIGREDSVYAGGVFKIELDFSEKYPFKPPKIKVLTKIYHPNIKQDTGEICTKMIDDKWAPTQNAREVLKKIVSLIYAPNLDDPLEPQIAEQYAKSPKDFEAKAREYVAKYAK